MYILYLCTVSVYSISIRVVCVYCFVYPAGMIRAPVGPCISRAPWQVPSSPIRQMTAPSLHPEPQSEPEPEPESRLLLSCRVGAPLPLQTQTTYPHRILSPRTNHYVDINTVSRLLRLPPYNPLPSFAFVARLHISRLTLTSCLASSPRHMMWQEHMMGQPP